MNNFLKTKKVHKPSEVMLAADIIHTIHKPVLKELYVLAMIVSIRSVISFFLVKEMGGIKSDKSLLPNDVGVFIK